MDICQNCKPERISFEKTIRELQEKLEHSLFQNSLLEKECKRLHEELREAKWNGFSTVRARPPPRTLPPEVLLEIFRHATSMNGLAFAHWHNRTKTNSWFTISFTRRSIPLVCRQWYSIGTEFLYKHIVLFTTQQTEGLMTVLRNPSHSFPRARVKAIQRLELLFQPYSIADDDDGYSFLSNAQWLLEKLTRGQLLQFNIEDMHCRDNHATQKLVASVLNRHRDSLEVLGLPNTAGGHQWKDLLSDPLIGSNLTLPRLRTLSIANECWWVNGYRWNARSLSGIKYPSLTELSVEWGACSPESILPLIRSVRNLRKLHVIYNNSLLMSQVFDLDLLPSLEHLSIYYNDHFYAESMVGWVSLTKDHFHLKEVVIWMKFNIAYEHILSAKPIFSLIRSGRLPFLHSITCHGPFPGGCLDKSFRMPRKYHKAWENAIRVCDKRGIALINSSGHSLHLWGMTNDELRTGSNQLTFNLDPGSQLETNPGQEPFSDEEEWVETETETSFEGSDHSSPGAISDDSEDTPYRFVHQPDVELVHSEPSDGEDEDGV